MNSELREGPAAPVESKHWKAIGLVLTVLIGTGTVTMGLGATVFVTRAEYVAKDRNDAVAAGLTSATMKQMSNQLASQQVAFDRLSEKIGELQIDLAVLGERKYLPRTTQTTRPK